MGFTETELGSRNAPLADRHSSAPAAERCTTWSCAVSATQQEPSVGFTETEHGQENVPLSDRHSSAPAAERCTTWPLPRIRHPAGAIRGVHRDGLRPGERAADRPPQLRPGRREVHHLVVVGVRHPAGAIRGVHRDGVRVGERVAGRPPQFRPGRRQVHHLVVRGVRHPAGAIRGVHRDGVRLIERAAGRPPQLRPGRREVHHLVVVCCPPPSRSHPWGSPRRTASSENAPLADRHSSAPAADRCTTWPP